MPTLHWIGKDKIVNHHQEIPYRVLKHKYGFSSEKGEQEDFSNTGNKIIRGDNLEALKSLLPEYEGKIKCIYIDPPYNTGNEKWVYNDNVNHPKIKKWLGEVVGKEAEDLTRHDKWLCMMYPRLKLLHKLLSNDGVIFISIDDNEVAHLKILMDEIFGENNFITNFSWVRKKKGSFLSKKVRKMLENIICYEKKQNNIEYFGEKAYSEKLQPLVKRTNSLKKLFFHSGIVETKLNDGIYQGGFKGNFGTGINFLSNLDIKNGHIINSFECEGNFVWTQEFLEKEIDFGTKIVFSNKFGFNVLRYNQEDKVKTPSTLINEENGVGTNEDATSDLQKIFDLGVNEAFNYSKPYSLIQYLIKMITHTDKNSIILDSFAGSGTTGHAVMKLNEQDGGNRKFILIEMEDYAETITAERNKRVINGYGEGDKKVEGLGGGDKKVEGLGGGFDFYELGESFFVDNEQKILNEAIGEDEMKKYIYYTETGDFLSKRTVGKNKYFMGKKYETGYYFYYEKDEITYLDEIFLVTITEKTGNYLIYADVCNLSESFMRKHNVLFKKIPRDITKI